MISGPVLPDIVIMAVAVAGGGGGNDKNVVMEVSTVLIPLFDVVYKEVLVIVLRDDSEVDASDRVAVESYESQ